VLLADVVLRRMEAVMLLDAGTNTASTAAIRTPP
jgi:hypothetical protein